MEVALLMGKNEQMVNDMFGLLIVKSSLQVLSAFLSLPGKRAFYKALKMLLNCNQFHS